METIFDFNPTHEELREITLIPKDEYLRISTDDSRASGLALLFYLRGNKRMMHKYYNQIKDVNLRNSFKRTISHP